MKKELAVKTEAELTALGETIGNNLSGGEVIELAGPLGAGKTTLAKGILKGAGAAAGFSPTFILNATFPVSGKDRLKEIHHLDLYRLKDASELTTLGLYDIIGQPYAAVIIEWADRFQIEHVKDKITIVITPGSDGSRKLKITGNENLWQNLTRKLNPDKR